VTWQPAPAAASGRSSSLRATGRAAAWALLVCWTLAACAVVGLSVVPRLFGAQILIVRSGSMAPAIPTGSIVVVRAVPPATLRVGDVITFERAEGIVATITHRVVAVEGNPASPTFHTKGDANAAEDPVTVTYAGMGGKVVASVPYLGYVQNTLGQPLARGLLIGAPAVALTWSYLRDLWRPRR
jgi:signal peptidase I